MELLDIAEISKKYPNLKEVTSCKSLAVDEVRRALHVYLDLAESKNWWNLDMKACEPVNKMLVTGHETQFEPQSIILPVRSDTVFSTEELENLKKCIKEQFGSESFFLGIVAPDSTVVYYRLSQGLVPPEPPELLEAKKQRRIRYQQRRRQRTMKFNQIADVMAIKSSSSSAKRSIKSSASAAKISIKSSSSAAKRSINSSPVKSSKSPSLKMAKNERNAAANSQSRVESSSSISKYSSNLVNSSFNMRTKPAASSTISSNITGKNHSSLFDTSDNLEQTSINNVSATDSKSMCSNFTLKSSTLFDNEGSSQVSMNNLATSDSKSNSFNFTGKSSSLFDADDQEQESVNGVIERDCIIDQNTTKMEIEHETKAALFSDNLESKSGKDMRDCSSKVDGRNTNCKRDLTSDHSTNCTESSNNSKCKINSSSVTLTQNEICDLNYQSYNYELTCRNDMSSDSDALNTGASNVISCSSDDHVTMTDLDSSVEGNQYTVTESSDWYPNMAPEDFESGDQYDDEFEGEL